MKNSYAAMRPCITMRLRGSLSGLQLVAVMCAAVLHFAAAAAFGSRDGHEWRSFFTSEKTFKEVNDPIIQEAGKFAVDELKKLSDSGIYTTLSLSEIQEAAAESGDFHYAIHLRVALASPHFLSRNATESFELMVLQSKDLPGRPAKHERSIAIDEFPVMDDDAIEEFWIRMVDERRAKRRRLFDQWAKEAKVHEEVAVSATASKLPGVLERQPSPSPPKQKKKKTLSLSDLQATPTRQLRKLLTSTGLSDELRLAITDILDARWDQLEHHEQVSVSAHAQGTGAADRDEL